MRHPPPPALGVENLIFAAGSMRDGVRMVPEESPVAFTYGRQTHAVMLATPADLEDFAVGFSLAEGVVSDPAEIESFEIVSGELGIELRMDLRDDRLARYIGRRRSLAGATGCGMCGLESLAEVARPAPPVNAELSLSAEEISAALAALAPAQSLNHETRAVHAAAFWTPQGGLIALREDVGRHNALDKLAGTLARRSLPGGNGAVVLTSRVSLEMVQKTARLGAGILIAVSAPTALAIRAADQCGLTLIAIARGREFEVFTHARRVREKRARHAG
jgi:FdhD protein